ncbi:hypothetical protein OIDMADRAFT_60701 [Oidiodendron maius Zn]|uniref:Extracellular membrane protein CFEM domain-containing protein n=1 Tax=Oidiodendron maius (strain Zn) TaxID=913774 RepID=A0A0C3GVM2_OIDMZ|nr:hypothetical protein OIDMADRAFT_60701 [Oidiodendron maius Zn]
MKFTLLFIVFAPMVFGDAFNFPTAGCVDEAGTTACLALADSAMAASCSTLCGCTDPFTCSQASDACLTGCVCVATQSYLNCVLSSCWNKVYSCEYQTLAVDAVNICPIAVPAGIPYFLSIPNQPGSCSCELSALWAATYAAPFSGLNCTTANPDAAASQRCACCAVEESISAYYDICNTVDPAYLPAAIKIPWGYYPQCESTLAGTDCTNLGFGLPAVNDSVLYSTLLPNGTATLSNQGGMLTSPPYGSTTAWYFLGSTGPATTATAAAYTAGNQGTQSTQGTQGTQSTQGTERAQSTQGSTGSGSKTESGSPSSTSSGATSEAAKVKGAAILFLVTLGLCLTRV